MFFSIVIPSYNRAGLISHTIRSFLQQDHLDFEVLVVDDGGSDNTKEVVEKFSDKRIRYFYKENGERGAARNYGAWQASGDYITFFDSDDIVYPWYLSHAKEKLEKLGYPECYAQAFEFRSEIPATMPLIDRQNEKTTTVNNKLRIENILACNGVFLKKAVFSNFSFSENRDLSGSEDWLLWLQLSAEYPFYYSPVVCSCLINHEQRGELNIKPEKLMKRLKLLISLVKNDKNISAMPRLQFKSIQATSHQFAALKMSDFTKLKLSAIGNILRALFLNPLIILRKTFYITVKKLLLSWHN